LPRLWAIRIDVVRRRPEWMNRRGICPSSLGCSGCPRKNALRFRVRSTVTRRAERDEIVERVTSSVARLNDVVNGQLRVRSAVPAPVAVSHPRLLAHGLPPALVQVGTVRGHGSTVAPPATGAASGVLNQRTPIDTSPFPQANGPCVRVELVGWRS